MEWFRLLFDYLAWIEHQFLSGIGDSRKAGSLWDMMRSVGGVRKSIYQSWLAKWLGLGLLYWGFKGVQEEIPSEEASSSNRVSGISTRTMHQTPTPSLSQTIWPRWTSRRFFTLPKVPVTFAYSQSSRKNLEAVVMRQLGRWKRLWRRSLTRSHKRTSMGLSWSFWNGTTSALQPEEITSKGTRVSCVCPNEKSLETYSMHLVYNTLLLNRIRLEIEKNLRKNQNGFRGQRSTTSQILPIHRIIEEVCAKISRRQFVDFSKAYDSIHKRKMEQILWVYSLP